jgi:hypothetical protein
MFPSPSSAFRPARLDRRDSPNANRLSTSKLPRKDENEARKSLGRGEGRQDREKKPGLY